MTDNVVYPATLAMEGARLRPLRKADALALYAYLRNPLVTERTSFPIISLSMVEAMIDRIQNRWASGELSKWGIVLDHADEVIGTCGFNDWSKPHRFAELAYDVAHPHWGKGLAQKAVSAVLSWAYSHDLIDRVQAFVRVDNERSIRLLERIGFLREGCLRSYRICRGQRHDFYLYGLLRSDWTTQHPGS